MNKPVLGMIIGSALAMCWSTLAAAGPPDRSRDIVWPGMLVGALVAQAPNPQDAMAPVSILVGRWTGTTEGRPGQGTVEREYERVLGARLIFEVYSRSRLSRVK